MPRKQKKYHYLYKTTNLINEKFYVGMHSTDDLEDGYLGSGVYLRRSIKKYGKENFKIEFLEFFDSREILTEKEINLINTDFIKEPLCMNLQTGGKGSPGHICSEETREKMRKPKSTEHKIKCALANLGKKHSDETKKKMSISRSGENNVMYGKSGENSPLFGKPSNNPNFAEFCKESAKKRRQKVYQFKDNKLIASYSSAYEASEKTGICRTSINKAVIGKAKNIGGFQWSLKNKAPEHIVKYVQLFNWSKDLIIEEAKKHNSKKEWRSISPASQQAARRFGKEFYKSCCVHMVCLRKPNIQKSDI